MKKNSNFSLQNLAGHSYILPIGQALCDGRPGFYTNESGAYIWQALNQASSAEEIADKMLEDFEISVEFKANVLADVKTFLNLLIKRDMLAKDIPSDDESSPPAISHYTGVNTSSLYFPAPINYSEKEEAINLRIGPLSIAFKAPLELLHANLRAFMVEDVNSSLPTLTINLLPYIGPDQILTKPSQAKPHAIAADVYFYKYLDGYRINYSTSNTIYTSYLDTKENVFTIFYKTDDFKTLAQDIFNFSKIAYLIIAAKYNTVAVHSASLIYQNKVWLFSAPSGTGKSTHTNLWTKVLETKVFNGDLNLVSIVNGKPVVYGSPWCGTSEIFNTNCLEFGGIIFLAQAPKDEIKTMPCPDNLLNLLSRLLTPIVDEDLLKACCDLVNAFNNKIYFAHLDCTMNPSAALECKKGIDSYINA